MSTSHKAQGGQIGQFVAQRDERARTFMDLINSMRPQIALALPKHMDPDRMARIATTLLQQTPQLREVVPITFIGALMTCSQLGLEPGVLGHAWIIPRKQDGVWVANFQLGYKGVIELARRSGRLAKITGRTVYSRELAEGKFGARYEGADEIVEHEPILVGERGKPVLYYAVARLTSGETNWAPLTPDEVEARHRQRSSAPNSPAWRNDYEAMAWKSCVVELRRWLPQSPQLEMAVAQDGQVRTDMSPDVLEVPPPDVQQADGADWGEVPGVIDAEEAPAEDAARWPRTAEPGSGNAAHSKEASK